MSQPNKVEVKGDFRKLNQVIQALTEGNKMAVKVGILSKKNARNDGESNASIGAIHEFGSFSKKIPKRSFIKMPLMRKSNEIVKEIQRLVEESLVTGDLVPLLKKVGVVAEGAIGEAFATKGFGTWAPIAPATERRKGSDAVLIETSQLQRSITSAVVKRGA